MILANFTSFIGRPQDGQYLTFPVAISLVPFAESAPAQRGSHWICCEPLCIRNQANALRLTSVQGEWLGASLSGHD